MSATMFVQALTILVVRLFRRQLVMGTRFRNRLNTSGTSTSWECDLSVQMNAPETAMVNVLVERVIFNMTTLRSIKVYVPFVSGCVKSCYDILLVYSKCRRIVAIARFLLLGAMCGNGYWVVLVVV